MSVIHSLNYLNGQSRLAGRDITIGTLVRKVADEGIDAFCESREISRIEVRDALKYCMNEGCVPAFATFCEGCKKNSNYSQRESAKKFWEIARNFYDKEFRED